MQELTLGNLIRYIQHKYVYGHLDESSQLIQTIGDGIDIYYMLEDLENDFNVNFKHFDYIKFFHTEPELSTLGSFSLKRRKDRPVESFNIKDLFWYMCDNKK